MLGGGALAELEKASDMLDGRPNDLVCNGMVVPPASPYLADQVDASTSEGNSVARWDHGIAA